MAQEAVSPLLKLWLLRLLVPLGAHRSLIDRNGDFANDGLAEVLGLSQTLVDRDKEPDPHAARLSLRRLHAQAEGVDASALAWPPVLARNIQRLAELVGLSPVDQIILAFVVHLHSDRLLDDTADWLGVMSSTKVFHVLSVVLKLPLDDVRLALGTQGILSLSGLVSLDRGNTNTLRSKLELLSQNFADHISSDDAAPLALLRDVVSPAAPPLLALTDYTHVQDCLAILLPYLQKAMETQRKGVNVFVHGGPGTGKSQLVRAVAHALGLELFEVASEDEDGDPVSGTQRLRAFRAAQSFFASHKALLLFDEVDDVFNDHEGHMGSRSTAQSRKAWMNRALESNPVPTFWLSNSIRHLDPAFVRRFDMFIELPVPPRWQRERILQSTCGGLLDAAACKRLSGSDQLAPAVVSRAASVVQSIAPELGAQGCADAFQLLVNHTLKAQGHKALAPETPCSLAEVYDPQILCADTDLSELTHGLVRTRSGRLCLYGPPGTGKTAYGQWLAEQMGMPLLVKRASDLMSPYLGETEQHMAQAFRQAMQDSAVLLIDEVDGFLQDRRGAHHSWQVSQVNEMLTQMESFTGVFILFPAVEAIETG